jgi:hypothetical protein
MPYLQVLQISVLGLEKCLRPRRKEHARCAAINYVTYVSHESIVFFWIPFRCTLGTMPYCM